MSNETNSEKHRKIGRIIAIVVAVLVIAVLIVGGARKKADAPVVTTDEGCKPGDLFSQTTGKPCPQEKESTVKASTTSTATLSFAQMQKIYTGRTVTINNGCKVTPEEQKLKKGTMVLLANASDTSKTILFASKTYTISPLHYRTVKLDADARGARYLVTCDGTPTQSAVTVEL